MYFRGKGTSWKLTGSCIVSSIESNMNCVLLDAYVGSGTNQSFLVSLRPGTHTLVSVFSFIPAAYGSLLGIFAGKVLFSEHCNAARSISGPTPQLWLDFSQVTVTLNRMRVALLTEEANLHPPWKGIDESVKNNSCNSGRVLVLASRNIVLFKLLVRAATFMEQFSIQWSSDNARRGFLIELRILWMTQNSNSTTSEEGNKGETVGINTKHKTLLIKIQELGEFEGVEIAVTLWKHGKYTTYISEGYGSQQLSFREIVSRVMVYLRYTTVLMFIQQIVYPPKKRFSPEDIKKRCFEETRGNYQRITGKVARQPVSW